MTQDMVRALPDELLAKVKVWAVEEETFRAEKRRHDTIARIRELAGTVGVSVTINGRRGRSGLSPVIMSRSPKTSK